MPMRKPLVMIDGQIRRMPSGDTLDAPSSGAQFVEMTNNNAGAAVIGMAVFNDDNDDFDLARANASGTSGVFGLVGETSIAAAASGIVVTDGILEATTAEWDAVTGDSGGLVAGDRYYLDPDTAGHITNEPPDDAGEFLVEVGIAMSTTALKVDIKTPIGL